MGTKGWIVYDRERKGPALLKNGDLAEKLTRERAEFIKWHLLIQESQRKGSMIESETDRTSFFPVARLPVLELRMYRPGWFGF